MAPLFNPGVKISSGYSSSKVTTVLPLGDSLTQGLYGNTGGYLSRIQTPVHFTGQFTNPVNMKHGGRGGDRLYHTTANDIYHRIASNILAYSPEEVWICGSTNDFVSDGISYSVCADRMRLVIDNQLSLRSIPTRWQSPAPWNGSTSPNDQIEFFWRRMMQPVVDEYRTLGHPIYFHHTGGRLTQSGLDNNASKHPLDTAYGVDGYGLWAQWLDYYLNGGNPLNPATLGLDFEYKVDSYSSDLGIWVDSSGNGLNATAISTKPSIITGSRGQNIVSFNGTSDALRSASISPIGQPFTIWFILDGITNYATQPSIIDSANTTDRLLIWSTPTGQLRVFATASNTDNEMYLYRVPHLYAVEFNGANTITWCDGNPRYNTMAPGTNSFGGVTLGASSATTPTNFLQGGLGYVAGKAGSFSEETHFRIACWFRESWKLWPTIGQIF